MELRKFFLIHIIVIMKRTDKILIFDSTKGHSVFFKKNSTLFKGAVVLKSGSDLKRISASEYIMVFAIIDSYADVCLYENYLSNIKYTFICTKNEYLFRHKKDIVLIRFETPKFEMLEIIKDQVKRWSLFDI